MKKFFTLMMIAVAFIAANDMVAQTGAKKKPVTTVGAPMLTVDKTEHDYGTIKKGANGDCTFTVWNTGDQPLIISQCQGSCGCTTPQCTKDPIMPGESTEIKVNYDTQRIGQFSKAVIISWNNPDGGSTTLNIKGNVTE